MYNLFLKFPNFTDKCLTFSYDDGTIHDKRLVELFSKYGVKATFNINSELTVNNPNRLTMNELYNLYNSNGMEVAVHGEYHLWPTKVPSALAMKEFLNDRINIEKDFNAITRGMAYAFGDYNDEIVEILKKVGR